VNSHITAGWESFWLNPRDKAFGPNAKYFAHDVAEAKKLLAAAGMASGLDTEVAYTAQGGGDGPKRVEVLSSMLGEVGVRVRQNPYAVTAQFTASTVQNPERNFPGMASTSKAPQPDPAIWTNYVYSSSSSRKIGAKEVQDPALDAMLQKMKQELDVDKRRSQIHEIQRHLAKAMWAIPHPGFSGEVTLGRPWVSNQGVYQPWVASPAQPALVYTNLWLDKSKLPA
jgi:ABC-type transport system substrate-binding protein